MKQILILIIFFPILSRAQESTGIKWTNGLSWEQVKIKANLEHKYIFLDCFTTWCGPCKMMERDVYSNDTVGNYFNEHFLSVKVQMDKTQKDNEQIQNWYNDADSIGIKYHVEGYPTFIFFSAQGVILNKDIGFKGVKDFIAIAKIATSPEKVYNDPYTIYDSLVTAYRQGKRDYNSYPLMIKMAFKSNDTAFLKKLIHELSNYAITLPPEERYTRDRIEMWAGFTWSSNTRVFNFFYKDGKLIDKIMGWKGYSDKVIDATITAEILTPFLEDQAKGSGVEMTGGYLTDISGKHLLKTDSSEADWNKLQTILLKKYSISIAKRNILASKIEWYKRHHNEVAVEKYSLMQLNQYPPDATKESFMINNMAWAAFINCNDKDILNEFTKWMEIVVTHHGDVASWIDTYASLLYKTGKKQKAIEWEEKAVKLASSKSPFQSIVTQMKEDKPIYLDKGAVWER